MVNIRSIQCRFTLLRLRLSLVPHDRMAARNRSCADESIVYFSHAALADFLPRTEAVQIWWVGVLETGGFPNQIARRA
jgi:hypothetical protein